MRRALVVILAKGFLQQCIPNTECTIIYLAVVNGEMAVVQKPHIPRFSSLLKHLWGGSCDIPMTENQNTLAYILEHDAAINACEPNVNVF